MKKGFHAGIIICVIADNGESCKWRRVLQTLSGHFLQSYVFLLIPPRACVDVEFIQPESDTLIFAFRRKLTIETLIWIFENIQRISKIINVKLIVLNLPIK
ncbi:MAG: hypothetical protein J6C86_03390 [Bacteroidaceae bacterium]|nr:hypothetical protein [Bacteroidaceae bacterium]